jgi:hypothetical protein
MKEVKNLNTFVSIVEQNAQVYQAYVRVLVQKALTKSTTQQFKNPLSKVAPPPLIFLITI